MNIRSSFQYMDTQNTPYPIRCTAQDNELKPVIDTGHNSGYSKNDILKISNLCNKKKMKARKLSYILYMQ